MSVMAAFMNDSEISSIIEVCKYLGSDKITERRKQAEVLEKLLSNQSYVKVLDVKTDTSHGFTWNDVFKASCEFMNKEVEKYRLDDAKGTGTSQTQRTLRENHLQASSNCLLNVIKAAGQDQPRLEVDTVLHHCLMAMKDSFMFEKFGRDHLAILNREILSKRGYWSKLKPNLWLSIFLMALKLFKSKLPTNITYVSLATLLNYVMHHGTRQSDISIKVKKKISFFTETLNNKLMLKKEHNLFKVWLDSTVELGFSVGFEDRHQLCMLTESTLNTFLDLCHDNFDSIELVVQFSTLAVIAHHPFGVEVGDPDFMCFNSTEEWLKLLRRLHSLIDFIIKVSIQRNRTAEKKVYELEPSQIVLAVRISRQIFSSAEMLTMDVTRMGEMDTTSANSSTSSSLTAGPSAKKKRLMSGFSELVERMKTIGRSKESIPWLQITTHLIAAHPSFPETHELKELLAFVVDVTHDCREYDMVAHCSRLFRIITIALFEHRGDSKELAQSSLQPDSISKLWDSIWNCLAANQCHAESYLLIATLLYYRLTTTVMARQTIQHLVRPGHSVPCERFSMLCLAAYLQRYKLPERNTFHSSGMSDTQLSFTLSWGTDPVGDRSIRSLLSEWLLHRQGKDFEPGDQLHLKLFAALSMKHPTLPGVELPVLLSHSLPPNAFDARCSELEATFRHVDLLDHEQTKEGGKQFAEKSLYSFPKSASVLEEQVSHASDLCVGRGVRLEAFKSITPDAIAVLDDAISLLSLIRDLALSRVVEDSTSLRPLSVNLLTAVLSLVLNEGTLYSRNCLVSLSAMFLSCPKQEKLGEDFLRPAAWKLCGQRMIRLSAKESGGDHEFADIRRGGASRPSFQSEALEEDKHVSLFDSSILSDYEAWQVELYRLMAVISCPPVIENEEAAAKHLNMKTELIQMLVSSGINPSSYTYLQMSFCILRPFAHSIPQCVDNNLLKIVTELLADVGQRFIHDYEAAVAVLELIPAASKHIASSGCFVTKRRIIDLLIEFQNGVRDDLFGPPVERAFYRCLASLPIADWVAWDAGSLYSTLDKQSPIALEVIAGLGRPLNSTSFAAGQVISQLFDGDSGWQETVLSTLSSTLLVSSDGSDQRETSIKNSIALQVFSSIVVKSYWAEKPALVTLLRFAKIRKIGTEKLQKVMEMAARQLEVDHIVWLESRLEFLLDRWFDGDDIETFPYGIYQISSLASFVEKYQKIVLPLLFLKKGQAVFQRVVSPSNVAEVMLQHSTAILAKILPPLSESKLRTEGVGAPIDRFAQTKYQELVQIVLDKAQLAKELEANFLDLILRLLFGVHDHQMASQLFDLNVVLPVPGSFRFDKKSVLDALRHFSHETIADPHLEPFDTLIQWASTRPWEAHSLIVELFISYETGCRLIDKQQALVRLAVASELLIKALERVPARANLMYYIFYSFVIRLGHIIRNEEAHETLRRGSMIIVKELLASVLPVEPDFVAQVAVTVVGYVTPLAKGSGELQWLARNILEFLIVDHQKQLKSVMNQLSPFPKLPHFAHLSRVLESNWQPKNLQQEIEVFLNLVDSLGHDNVPVESVENLARLLGKRKDELNELYRKLNEEEVHGSIHRLICCLVTLAKTSGLCEAVASALGELGPADLSTFVLQPDNPIPDKRTLKGQMESHAQNHPILQQAMAIFPLLVRYLFSSESVQLTEQSGKVMLSAMGTIEGQQFGVLTKKYSWPSYNLTMPFRVKPFMEQKDAVLDYNYFEENVDDPILWAPLRTGRSSWLIRLTCTLINCLEEPNFYATLLPVCRLQPDFCSTLLPFVVRAVLDAGDQKTRRVISSHINSIFSRASDWTGKSANPCIKNLLAVVQYLRTQEKSKKPDGKWDNNFRLELNYSDAARAAQSCSAFFTTIMYAEIWLDRLNITGHSEPIHGAEDKGFRKPDQLMDLLYDAYLCTGEPDACTGFQSLLSDVRRFEQESNWFRALECHDGMASFDDPSDHQTPILSALAKCGLYKTASDLSTGYGPSMSAVREYQFQCAWRLGNWDQHHVLDCSDEKPEFHQSVFNCLFALKQGDHLELANHLSEARSIVLSQIKKAGSLESCRIIYPALSALRTVQDIDDFRQYSKELPKLREKWALSVKPPVSDFSLLEPSLAIRAVMLKEFLPASGEASTTLNEILLDSCRKARQYKNYPLAGRCLMQISRIPTLNMENQLVCRLEQALTEWQRKDSDRALNIVKSLSIVMEKDYPTHACYPRVLSLAGRWMHETRCENPRQILALYLKKSLDAAVAIESRKQWTETKAPSAFGVSDARQVLAAYADSLYKDLQGYIESRDFETQQKLAKIRMEQAEELKKLKASASGDDVRRANFFMTNETTKDKNEFETLFQERESYLLQAIENYLIGIKEETGRPNRNSSFDIRISRLISLWFDNRANNSLTELLVKWLGKLPSYLFLPVLPQLAARLVSKPNPSYHDEFPKLITGLIEKCAIEHPHHTLPVLMALAMTNRDKEIMEGNQASQTEDDRVTTAKKLIQKIAKRPETSSLCKKLEQLHANLILFANKVANPRDRSQDATKLPSNLANLKDMEEVAVPTVTLPVNPDGVYPRIVGIVSFEPTFQMVGGINAPKKMACLGTDGRTRPMLLKGKDDLRQDAVMQQVFSTMTLFLEQDEEARRRKLNIRKYKVVPLSRRSGLLEWCEGTLPIGLYLIGKDSKSGAHLRYRRSDDLTTEEAIMEMSRLADVKSVDEKLRRFKEISSRFPPVFRHFFLERFSAPSLWFEKRLSYTRSVAASSMVGYILGLGDRHLQNILIDEQTAELIHIDLGIAFDQGTVLPTPETVPFRLTRDIVDAMGVLGVEGVFRRCCEFTMEVMRKQQDSILTLLEVLLYDPLYVWTVTPQKAAAVQQKQKGLVKRRGSVAPESAAADDDAVDNQVNESAKRTLVRLSQKLKGVEKGTPLSVRGQVNLLIQQASDPANLSRIYHGWKPQA